MEYKNILNVEDIDKFVKRISRERPEHVAVWLRSTFSRWLRKGNGTTLQCVCARRLNDPLTKLMLSLATVPSGANVQEQVAKALHPVKVKELPDWAQASMEDHELWYWSPTEEDQEQYNHWVDYLMTLPERDIRMTVDQLVIAVAAWDKQLAKQKMIASLSEGVEVMQSPALESTDYFMVKLLTKTAYKNEGAVMSHCVAGYFGRHGVEIYSLRNAEKAKPCATIEVRQNKRGGAVHQIKAFANKKIDPVDEVALNAWLKEVGFTNFMAAPWGEDDEGEACEEYDEDDDEMEEEDDEEEVRPVKRGPKAKKAIDEEDAFDDEDSGDW